MPRRRNDHWCSSKRIKQHMKDKTNSKSNVLKDQEGDDVVGIDSQGSHSPFDRFIQLKLGSVTPFSDKASTVLPLVSHHVKCQITYPVIQVVSTMTFQNDHSSKTIEGEVVLP